MSNPTNLYSSASEPGPSYIDTSIPAPAFSLLDVQMNKVIWIQVHLVVLHEV